MMAVHIVKTRLKTFAKKNNKRRIFFYFFFHMSSLLNENHTYSMGRWCANPREKSE